VSKRRLARFLPAFALIFFAMLWSVACGGDDDEGHREPLAPPPVSPNLTVLHQGSFSLNVSPDGIYFPGPQEIDGLPMFPDDCASLVLLFSYRTDGKKELKVKGLSINNPSSNQYTDIVQGSEGSASVPACQQVGFLNDGSGAVSGEVKYVVARTR